MYAEGNPFAWHLYYESKLVYTSDHDFLLSLGKPSDYANCKSDLLKFKILFEDSKASIKENNFSDLRTSSPGCGLTFFCASQHGSGVSGARYELRSLCG